MDFRERLQKAANRGMRSRAEREHAEAAQALNEEECRRRHSAVRLDLCDHIESCLRQLADNFPGFNFSTVADEKGWGSSLARDDLAIRGGKRQNLYSRLQVTVGAYVPKYKVLSISAKGAVRNKESFARDHFESIEDLDEQKFRELIELWVLDYAEQYAAG